jgi:hypothetical protein
VRSVHPYVLLHCDACGMLAEAAYGRRSPAYAPAAGADDDELSTLGSGLLVFVRGDETRYEEPPLCARCSVAIGVTALVRWAEEEEEG